MEYILYSPVTLRTIFIYEKTDEQLDKASEYLKEMIVVATGGFGDLDEEMGSMREKMRTGFKTLISKQDQTINEIKLTRGDLNNHRG